MSGERRSSTSFCRFCHSCCPIVVETEGHRVLSVRGDVENEMYHGYTCVKGRSIPEQHASPDRLLHSQKREPDGTYHPISSEQAMDEIAERLQRIVERHGPHAVASYGGTYGSAHPATGPMNTAFMNGLGSSRRFSSMTIDQPGKAIAKGLLGIWLTPPQGFDDADCNLILGSNPLVSIAGGLPNANPRRWLHHAKKRGFKLIVADPRRTETASQADLHLRIRPGTDIALLAGLLNIILTERLHDGAFTDAETSGVAELAQAVAPFTPAMAAARTGVAADDIVRAAKMFAAGPRGVAAAGTGPNMSTARGTLLEYLVLCLNTVCGRWLKAGEPVWNPGTLTPPMPAQAMAFPPVASYGFGMPLRVRGLADTLAGPSTAALPDEILLEGEHQVRALISCGGNPVAAWPDQLKVVEALDSLDLLVQVDPWMSATARRAHYVIAPRLPLEMPAMTSLFDMLVAYAPGWGWAQPHAHYTAAVVDPPPGSDVIAEWELFYGLARRLGLELHLRAIDMNGPTGTAHPVDMTTKPTDDELFVLLAAEARVPLDVVKQHPHGVSVPSDAVVAKKDEGWEHRLDVANEEMLRDLAVVAGESDDDRATWAGPDYPFRLISRRSHTRYNSGGHTLPTLLDREPTNPAYMHPEDLERLGIAPGDRITIASRRAAIPAVAGSDPTVLPGLVSMTHAFGDAPERDAEVGGIGASTGRLCDVDDAYDPYSGQPVMSNIPVAVRPAG